MDAWTATTQMGEPVRWDGTTFWIQVEDLEMQWTPITLYLARIRCAGEGDWSMSVETPLRTLRFIDLIPDTEYEIELRAKTGTDISSPVYEVFRTDSQGEIPISDEYRRFMSPM